MITQAVKSGTRNGGNELPPLWVIRPPAKVVEGDVEEVREGDEIVEDRGTIAVFISLVANG